MRFLTIVTTLALVVLVGCKSAPKYKVRRYVPTYELVLLTNIFKVNRKNQLEDQKISVIELWKKHAQTDIPEGAIFSVKDDVLSLRTDSLEIVFSEKKVSEMLMGHSSLLEYKKSPKFDPEQSVPSLSETGIWQEQYQLVKRIEEPLVRAYWYNVHIHLFTPAVVADLEKSAYKSYYHRPEIEIWRERHLLAVVKSALSDLEHFECGDHETEKKQKAIQFHQKIVEAKSRHYAALQTSDW